MQGQNLPLRLSSTINRSDGMDAVLSTGPQMQDNGTFMETEKMLTGNVPQGLTALVVNKSLEESAEMMSQLRASALSDMGIGQRLNITA